MSNRRLFRSTVSAVLILAFSIPTSGVMAVEAWTPDVSAIEAAGFPVDYTAGNELLYVREEGGSATSAVYSYLKIPGQAPIESFEVCADAGPNIDCGRLEPVLDEETGELVPVETSGVAIGGTAMLPNCSSVVESCVESLEIASSESDFSMATYSGTTSGSHFRGNPSLGIPSGVGPAIYKSTVTHTGGSEYAIRASMQFDYDSEQAPSRRVSANEFSLRVFATQRVTGGYRPSVAAVCEDTPDGKSRVPCINESQECVYVDSGICGIEHELAEGTSFRVTLILTNKLSGWFRGRLQDPVISVDPIDASYSRVTIAGDTVTVPRFLATFALAKGDPDIVGALKDNSHGGPFTLFEAASQRAMEIVQGMRARVNDTAAGTSEIWSVNSISAYRAASTTGVSSQCLADTTRLLGIVTTNAMTYLGTVPSYDSGYLSYKVAGLHYAPDGETVNEGTYDLVMRSDVARCLYGFKNAPISATVAVVGEMGEEKVATTIVSEKDGWLKLAAYGFTFSEKEIQVQLRQSQIKTLTNFTSGYLSSKQKAEIRAVLAKSDGNTKFICTGIRYYNQPVSDNIKVRARAKAACDYAKSINPNFSYWYQTKTTQARSYNGKVMIVSKR
jgi:hypothetical protein